MLPCPRGLAHIERLGTKCQDGRMDTFTLGMDNGYVPSGIGSVARTTENIGGLPVLPGIQEALERFQYLASAIGQLLIATETGGAKPGHLYFTERASGEGAGGTDRTRHTGHGDSEGGGGLDEERVDDLLRRAQTLASDIARFITDYKARKTAGVIRVGPDFPHVGATRKRSGGECEDEPDS